MPCPALSCLVLSYIILSYLIPSYLRLPGAELALVALVEVEAPPGLDITYLVLLITELPLVG